MSPRLPILVLAVLALSRATIAWQHEASQIDPLKRTQNQDTVIGFGYFLSAKPSASSTIIEVKIELESLDRSETRVLRLVVEDTTKLIDRAGRIRVDGKQPTTTLVSAIPAGTAIKVVFTCSRNTTNDTHGVATELYVSEFQQPFRFSVDFGFEVSQERAEFSQQNFIFNLESDQLWNSRSVYEQHSFFKIGFVALPNEEIDPESVDRTGTPEPGERLRTFIAQRKTVTVEGGASGLLKLKRIEDTFTIGWVARAGFLTLTDDDSRLDEVSSQIFGDRVKFYWAAGLRLTHAPRVAPGVNPQPGTLVDVMVGRYTNFLSRKEAQDLGIDKPPEGEFPRFVVEARQQVTGSIFVGVKVNFGQGDARDDFRVFFGTTIDPAVLAGILPVP